MKRIPWNEMGWMSRMAPRFLLLLALVCLPVCPIMAGTVTLPVYDDSLQSGFADWSWCTRNLAQTAIVHGGTAAISMEPDNWAGIYFHRDAGIDLSVYHTLEFWIHGGASGGQNLRLALIRGGQEAASVSLATVLPGGALPGGQWAQVQIAFSTLGLGTDSLEGFYLVDNSGTNQATVYVDDIRFLGTDTPVQTTVAVAVTPLADRRAISPLIYGVNRDDSNPDPVLPYPVVRWGGNHRTRYSWEQDASNRAMDWFYMNIPEENPNPSLLPNGSMADRFVSGTLTRGSDVLLTVPCIGWTPKDRTVQWGFSVAKYGAQQKTECTETEGASYCRADAGNGVLVSGANVTGNDPHDTSVEIGPDFVSRWIVHLKEKVGTAASGGVRFYALDNEPMLWNSTHRDVHPTAVSYDELWQRTESYAAAIKAQDPGAMVLGPVVWGWCAYFYSAADGCSPGPDRQAHGNQDLLPWYLAKVRDYENRTGVRLVDYLDVHCYPQADGVYSDNESTAALRLRSLRSLYDPAYTDESWIGQPVRLIPRMKEWIQANAPGTKLAITEYSWGGDAIPSGALAQAEILAIFGREGVDLATRWIAPAPGSRAEDAFRLYLNYDGAGSMVSGESCRAVSADIASVGAYAVYRPDGAVQILLFNKATSERIAKVSVAGVAGGTANLFRFDPDNRLRSVGQAAFADGTLSLALPARSATLAVVVPSYGDLNGDGTVSATDVSLLSAYLRGDLSQGEGGFTVPAEWADVNRDGKVDAVDLPGVLLRSLGILSSLPF